MHKSSNKQSKCKLGDFIHGNDISTYAVAVMENFSNLSVVIATHRKTEIMVLIIKKIPK